MAKTPAPVLDARNEDLVTAECIGELPAELSDRSDANPAVVVIEAMGAMFGKLIYQLNRWPQAVVQKGLSLCGVTALPASAATVSQTFTLSSPQDTDTTIPAETQVANDDASVVFETLSDITIPAYTTPSGTVAITSGSTTVTGSGTAFQTGTSWAGWQIQIPADSGTWYEIASVSSATSLTLSSAATSTTSGQAWNVGPVTGSVSAQATTTGIATNVGADTLTTLVSSVNGVASTTNAAAATGGAEAETGAESVERAPSAFAGRDTACQESDFEDFAVQILGNGGRAKAKANYNGTSAATGGYTTVGLLSPAWTTASTCSALERAAVVRDLNARMSSGTTLVDIPATIDSLTPTILVWKDAKYDDNTVKVNAAAAVNEYLSPNTYPWGRTVYLTSLADAVKQAEGVDRIEEIDGLLCLTADATTTTANEVTFTLGSTSATGTAGDFSSMVGQRSILIDGTNRKAYRITNISSGTLTLDRAYESTSNLQTCAWFTPDDTALTNVYTLPYSNLSVDSDSPAATIIIVGSVE